MFDTDAQPNLTPAEQNPWYVLATLHGVSAWWNAELAAKNRVTWNRYYASQWTEDERERLKGKVAEVELQPFGEQELVEIKRLFKKRANNNKLDIPTHHDVIDCRNCQFIVDVDFSGYIFREIYISNVIFYRHFRSIGSVFFRLTDFSGVTFSRSADFRNATFSADVHFSSAVFCWDTSFSNAIFSSDTSFYSATFSRRVSFINTELKGPTEFERCRFEGYPPEFAGAKLHEGTVWRRVSWPRPPASVEDAGLFTDAYERLKLEMDRLKKHEDELMFFAKELECRRVAAGQFRGLPIGIYGVLCHYGQSYLRPLGWLLALILVGAVQFWPVLGWDCLLSLGVSTANVLGPFGLRKELVDPEALKDLSRWLLVLTAAQMVLGPVLLFLIGLGLRNRFRMK